MVNGYGDGQILRGVSGSRDGQGLEDGNEGDYWSFSIIHKFDNVVNFVLVRSEG